MSRPITYKGITYKSIKNMCLILGFNYPKVLNRLNAGYTLETAIINNIHLLKCVSVDHCGNKFESIKDMCDFWGIDQERYHVRMERGWEIKRALTEPINTKFTPKKYLKQY